MTRTPTPIVITLTHEEQQELAKPWVGGGGFQTLGPELLARVRPDGSLSLTDDDVGTIVRHMNYVQSGFRDRVRKVFARSLSKLMTHK